MPLSADAALSRSCKASRAQESQDFTQRASSDFRRSEKISRKKILRRCSTLLSHIGRCCHAHAGTRAGSLQNVSVSDIIFIVL
ncbi:hypothetical protein BCV69DRAFT_65468 [Microstroma glucosiphilum]|uniref:Uncharacterized protein n=1 Tax=Pseudomicrostroma glucosiphilum TaxID=1684307 RepID=A0A316TZM8_9BASI|nr:hypothetical protein BCV69DRAFT_65468 [Pseudomicrostroma glucosiphilum]PWN18547.1 hypothetical protein BCV69DRAFT_65468 [Pseudomicrostroma glucosiphilum]